MEYRQPKGHSTAPIMLVNPNHKCLNSMKELASFVLLLRCPTNSSQASLAAASPAIDTRDEFAGEADVVNTLPVHDWNVSP